MASKQHKPESTAQRLQAAFERLKAGTPQIVRKSTRISQRSVAIEASCDPTALRQSRYPELLREIKAYVEEQKLRSPSKRQASLQRKQGRRAIASRLEDTIKQRDAAQSMLLNAERAILELHKTVDEMRHHIQQKPKN